MPALERSSSTTPGLVRDLGVTHAASVVIGIVVGSGIFLVPQEMMRAVGSSSLVYLAWITGGLLSLFGAMTYAELSAMMPAAGGEYVYLRGAYGDLPAFLYMWTWFAVAKPASIAHGRHGSHGSIHRRAGPCGVCKDDPAGIDTD